METKKEIVDGVEMNVSPVTIGYKASGWYDIEVKLWCANVYLFVGSIEEFRKSGREYFKGNKAVLKYIDGFTETGNNKALATVKSCGENEFVIHMHRYRPCAVADILVLSHESLHAAQMILYNVKAEVNHALSETLAYTHEYIFGRLMSEILKRAGGHNAEEKPVSDAHD